jgi:threonine dehydratase
MDDIERAAALIEGVAVRTPMEESRWLSALTNSPVLL